MSQQKHMVVAIDCNGQVEAMCQENILPLGFLGKQEIRRASELKWDSNTDSWAIHVAKETEGEFHEPYPEATGFPTYDDARDAEVVWFSECRRQDVQPQSEAGHLILQTMRPTFVQPVCEECGAPV